MNSERRALARLARRSVIKAPLRSILLIVMVAVLVAVGSTVAIVGRSTVGAAREGIVSGPGAANTSVWFGSIDDQVVDSIVALLDSPVAVLRTGELAVFPPGSGPFDYHSRQQPKIQGFDGQDLLLSGQFGLVDGRFPESVDEVALSPLFAKEGGYQVGQTIVLDRTELTVVGLVSNWTQRFDRGITVTPARFDQLTIAPSRVRHELFFTVDLVSAGRVLNDVQNMVGHEIYPSFREGRVEHGVDGQLVVSDDRRSAISAWEAELVSVVLPSVLTLFLATQIVLIGAVAFGVSIRNRVRELAQLVTVGANDAHLRRVLRYEAGWIGLVGALLGTALAILVSLFALRIGWFFDESDPRYTWGLRLRLRDVVGPAVLGFSAILIASRWAAGRLDGRSASAAASATMPVSPPVAMKSWWGFVLFGLAYALIIATQHVPGPDVPVLVVGFVLAFVGILIVSNAILAWAGSRADRLPLLPRLVVRATGRNRSRHAAVIGALVVTLAVPLLVAAAAEHTPDEFAGLASSSAAFGDRVLSIEAVGSGQHDVSRKDTVDDLRTIEPRLVEALQMTFGPTRSAELLQLPGELSVLHQKPDDLVRLARSTGYVATPDLMNLLQLDDSTRSSLAQGAIVSLSGLKGIVDGEMAVQVERTTQPSNIVVGPTVFVDRSVILLSSERARQLGLSPSWVGSLFVTERPTEAVDRATFVRHANQIWTDEFGTFDLALYNEGGLYRSPVGILFETNEGFSVPAEVTNSAISAAVAAVIALLLASLVAVELDREVGLMISVGAMPILRRKFIALQTFYQLVVAVVVALPIALVFFNLVIRMEDGTTQIVVPWRAVLLVGIAVPLVVAALVGLLFRNGSPAISRRIA